MKLLVLAIVLGLSSQACKTPSKLDSGLSDGPGGAAAEGPMCTGLDITAEKNPVKALKLRMFLEKMAALGNERARLLLASAESGMVVDAFYKGLNEQLNGQLLTCGMSCSVVKEEMVKTDVEAKVAKDATGQAYGENVRPIELPGANGKFRYDTTRKKKSLSDQVREALNYKEPGSTQATMTTLEVAKMFQDYVASTYTAEAAAGTASPEIRRARYVAMSNAIETIRNSGVITSATGEALIMVRGMQEGMVSHLERILNAPEIQKAEVQKLKEWRAEIARAFNNNAEAIAATNIDKTIAEMEKGGRSAELQKMRELTREGLEKAIDLERGRTVYKERTGVDLDRAAFERMRAP